MTTPIMHEDNWPQEWKSFDLTNYRSVFKTKEETYAFLDDCLKENKLFKSFVMGDGEVLLLNPLIATKSNRAFDLLYTTGLIVDAHIQKAVSAAIEYTSNMFTHSLWEEAARLNYYFMENDFKDEQSFNNFKTFLTTNSKTLHECTYLYDYIMEGKLLENIKNKVIHIVGGYASELGKKLGDLGYQIGELYDFPRDKKISKHTFFEKTIDQMIIDLKGYVNDQTDNIVLVSCGSMSSIVTAICEEDVRIPALDIGSCDQFLLLGERKYDE